MHHDEELLALFQTESEERWQEIEEGLRLLAADPNDRAALDATFREAHNLKGAARMIGAGEVEAVAHRFEELLGEARGGSLALSAQVIDRLYRGLDAIRKLVDEAVTGRPSGVDVSTVLDELDAPPPIPPSAPAAGEHGGATETAGRPLPFGAETEIPPQQIASPLPKPEPARTQQAAGTGADSPQASPETFRIGTIRVEPQKLDALLVHAAELIVTKTRIVRRLAAIDEIVALWRAWDRDAAEHRLSGAVATPDPTDGGRGRLSDYHERERERLSRLGASLAQLAEAASEDSARLSLTSTAIEEGIRGLRLLPLSTIFNLFPPVVRDLARQQSKEAQLVITGGDTIADKRILEEMKDPLMHLIRNAVDHGIEPPEERESAGKPRTGTIVIRAWQTSIDIVIAVEDDGRGLDVDRIQRAAQKRGVRRDDELLTMSPAQVESLIFTSGLSTSTLVTDVSGRGVGLDAVRANVERLKGRIEVQSSPGARCAVTIRVPLTVATQRVLLVFAGGRAYALPLESVETLRMLTRQEVYATAGQDTMALAGRPVPVARLSDLLEIPDGRSAARSDAENARFTEERFPCVILRHAEQRLALVVDALGDEQEVVLKPFGPILKRVRNVSGATILATGEVCAVLNVVDLIQSASQREGLSLVERPAMEAPTKLVVLLVEDSMITRAQERRVLEGAGYDVVTAVDGLDAWNKLSQRHFDAVVTDVQMPNLDGLALTHRIRQEDRYQDLPVILVTSLATDADKKRGLELGASAYITKMGFDQSQLLDALQRLA